MNPLEMKIEEYIPLIRPTIIQRAKSLIEPVVNTYNETTANNVVTVVKTERVNVEFKAAFKMSLKFLASGMYLML